MRWICLLLALSLVSFQSAWAGHKPPQVTLRVHIQVTGQGMSAQEATTIQIPPNGEQIQVRTLPEASERDLVAVTQDAGGLHIQFDHIGTVALNAVTGENQGRILVVLINGGVFYAPIIDAQIGNGRLDIPHQVDPQIVALLQALAQKNVQQATRS